MQWLQQLHGLLRDPEAHVLKWCLSLYVVFFTPLLAHALLAPRLFTRRHARGHRVSGAVHLAVLMLGLLDLALRCGTLVSGLEAHVHWL